MFNRSHRTVLWAEKSVEDRIGVNRIDRENVRRIEEKLNEASRH